VRLVGGTPTEPAWVYGLAGALMLGGPMARELYVTHYPARPEAFLLPLFAAAVGATIAIGSRFVRGLLGSVVFGGLLFAFSDLQFDPQRWTYFALVLAGCLVLAQLLVRHRAAIAALGLGAFYLTSLGRPGIAPVPTRLERTGPSRPDKPLLVQVSRFDRFKDPLGVIAAYRMVKKYHDCRLILAGADANSLARTARARGMRTLFEDGWQEVREGVTTPEELVRVTQVF